MKKIVTLQINLLAVAAALAMLVGGVGSAWAFDTATRAGSSKLATGRWVKVKVTESGIYAITAADARNWGMSDLSKVHVFGFGGAPISEKLTSDIPDDLPQVPVLRTGDKILFYAQGPTVWTVQRKPHVAYVQEQHPYATAGYYFVTDEAGYDDVPVSQSSTPVSGSNFIDTFIERLYHEQESVNPGETGQSLLGEDFRYTSSQSFKFDLDGLVDGSDVSVETSFAAKTFSGSSSLRFQCNGNNLPFSSSDTIPMVKGDLHYIVKSFSRSVNTSQLNGANTLTWNVSFTPQGALYLARLDYITVNYKRHLALANGKIAWGQPNGAADCTYRVEGGSADIHIWDVTASNAPIAMNVALDGHVASFSPVASGHREYVAFSEAASYPSPQRVGTVQNQNIHGEETPDMIIITPSEYLAQARRVASLHETVDSMRVLVVEQDKVFNEFSSGTPDAMAYRMLCKSFYDRGRDAQGHKLGYLLLFGNGSHDNRQLTANVRAAQYPMLLTWQSKNSASENLSYTSDDPFVMLADGSGPQFECHNLDIAVGRFPVKSVDEARVAVDKLVKYVTVPDNGAWKNVVLSVADDEDNATHMIQSENVEKICKNNGGSEFKYNKLYLDAFTAQSSGAGRSYPEANAKLYHSLSEGVFWLNYAGHASPNAWTENGLLTHAELENNFFYHHLPILYAATCDFTRFDAVGISGGERLFLNSHGGVIALVCPPRLVFISQNGALHSYVAKYTFKRDSVGKALRIGDILRLGKNEYRASTSTRQESNNQRYFLFGDPAMRPAYPIYRAVIETINGQEVGEDNMPVFQARQTLNFTGKIVSQDGSQLDFNGPVIATLYDSEQSVVTHGYGQGTEYTFLDRGNRLAVKVDTVRNGSFSFNITVPSEVIATYDNFSPSMISLYAYDNSRLNSNLANGGGMEAQGANTDFYIYGYDDTVVPDTIGPNIAYMGLNSETFEEGDKVNESPLFIAAIEDQSGINLSASGIGHSMTLTLDGTKVYSDVTSYFTPMPTQSGEGTAGTIAYRLSDLDNGHHTLKLKVWDVFNNSSEKTISFIAMSGLKPELYDVYTDANPASVEANFYVRHNRPDANLTVTIQVFDLLGREVWSNTQTGRSDMFTSFPIHWTLVDHSGARVARGIYVYRATITTDGVQEVTKAKKIAVTAP